MSTLQPPVWPGNGPESERKVFEALRAQLRPPLRTWYSLRIRTERGEFGEGDFVIADPSRGILVLEVKGGRIEKRHGQWLQNGMPLDRSPLAQAHAFRSKLLWRYREAGVAAPTIGVAVCFCDTAFDTAPHQDDLRGLVIGAQDLPHLDRILPGVFDAALPVTRPTSGGWVSFLDRIWQESWVPTVSLASRVQDETEQRVRLDRQQFEHLAAVLDNDRVLVLGGAGTGKTVLATQLARHEADAGRRVLMLCFTDALGFALSDTLAGYGVQCAPIRRFARELVAHTGQPMDESGGPQFWEEISLKAACDGITDVAEQFDTVIVDEAQDMGENEWLLIQSCLRPDGRLWIFGDPEQAFWQDRNIPDDMIRGTTTFRLRQPYRCAPPIQALADAYAIHTDGAAFEAIQPGLHDDTIRIVTASAERLHRQVGKEVGRLIHAGLQPRDIAVISLRGMGAAENIMHREELGGIPTRKATDPDAADHLVCDTFLRFKGLERPAVIVTDLRLVSDHYARRMHIAVSRALHALRIVGVQSEVRADPVLARLLNNDRR